MDGQIGCFVRANAHDHLLVVCSVAGSVLSQNPFVFRIGEDSKFSEQILSCGHSRAAGLVSCLFLASVIILLTVGMRHVQIGSLVIISAMTGTDLSLTKTKAVVRAFSFVVVLSFPRTQFNFAGRQRRWWSSSFCASSSIWSASPSCRCAWLVQVHRISCSTFGLHPVRGLHV